MPEININTIVTGIAILTAAAWAVAFYKAKAHESQLEFLRKDRDDLIVRIKQRDDTINEQKALQAEQQKQIESLTDKVEILTQIATGESHIKLLVDEFKRHDLLVEERYKNYSENLGKILDSQLRIEKITKDR